VEQENFVIEWASTVQYALVTRIVISTLIHILYVLCSYVIGLCSNDLFSTMCTHHIIQITVVQLTPSSTSPCLTSYHHRLPQCQYPSASRLGPELTSPVFTVVTHRRISTFIRGSSDDKTSGAIVIIWYPTSKRCGHHIAIRIIYPSSRHSNEGQLMRCYPPPAFAFWVAPYNDRAPQ